MAWPPSTLPVNRTNSTPQTDAHPADHNAANLAINDTVGYVRTISMQSGATSATTNGLGVAGFSFNAFFVVNPVVLAQVVTQAATGLIVTIWSVTTGGFEAQIAQSDNTPFVGTITLFWIASNNRVLG